MLMDNCDNDISDFIEKANGMKMYYVLEVGESRFTRRIDSNRFLGPNRNLPHFDLLNS